MRNGNIFEKFKCLKFYNLTSGSFFKSILHNRIFGFKNSAKKETVLAQLMQYRHIDATVEKFTESQMQRVIIHPVDSKQHTNIEKTFSFIC